MIVQDREWVKHLVTRLEKVSPITTIEILDIKGHTMGTYENGTESFESISDCYVQRYERRYSYLKVWIYANLNK